MAAAAIALMFAGCSVPAPPSGTTDPCVPGCDVVEAPKIDWANWRYPSQETPLEVGTVESTRSPRVDQAVGYAGSDGRNLIVFENAILAYDEDWRLLESATVNFGNEARVSDGDASGGRLYVPVGKDRPCRLASRPDVVVFDAVTLRSIDRFPLEGVRMEVDALAVVPTATGKALVVGGSCTPDRLEVFDAETRVRAGTVSLSPPFREIVGISPWGGDLIALNRSGLLARVSADGNVSNIGSLGLSGGVGGFDIVEGEVRWISSKDDRLHGHREIPTWTPQLQDLPQVVNPQGIAATGGERFVTNGSSLVRYDAAGEEKATNRSLVRGTGATRVGDIDADAGEVYAVLLRAGDCSAKADVQLVVLDADDLSRVRGRTLEDDYPAEAVAAGAWNGTEVLYLASFCHPREIRILDKATLDPRGVLALDDDVGQVQGLAWNGTLHLSTAAGSLYRVDPDGHVVFEFQSPLSALHQGIAFSGDRLEWVVNRDGRGEVYSFVRG